ncbi:Translation initiation factor 3 subunit b [Puttea exsequens]|nr:Translation initiation factor 3 subunit b [Puttea exsequens]
MASSYTEILEDEYPCCSAMPPHLMQAIIDRADHHDPATVAAMKRTLSRTQHVREKVMKKADDAQQRLQETGRMFGPPLHESQQALHGHGGSGSAAPPYLLQHIADSEHNAPETRDAARRTQDLTAQLSQGREHHTPAAGTSQPPSGGGSSKPQEGGSTGAGAGASTGGEDDSSVIEDPVEETVDMSMGAGYTGSKVNVSKTDSSDPIPPGPGKIKRLYRVGCDAKNKSNLPGTRITTEDDANYPSDQDLVSFLDSAGWTWSMYWNRFGRNSIKDLGENILGTVHVGDKFCNAMWTYDQMIFGDGDGKIFNSWSSSMDINAHEMTHGVIFATSNLIYRDQSGALNEHCADVFGLIARTYRDFQKRDDCDWLIGKEIFKSGKDALRSFKAPGTAYDTPGYGKDPQPAHMKNYVLTFDDNGGVHYNSGIPNKAFYNACNNLGDKGEKLWLLPGKIWYTTMVDRSLGRNCTFSNFAKATCDNAYKLDGGTAAADVKQAWNDVGVTF